ncbi:hypothetical protein D6783_02160 [Candidatus Woesearchaeota archaeon]|nr:MAG: hypothetical protein D6783_02160 [Candidatus Woesearchaeota archaeon]
MVVFVPPFLLVWMLVFCWFAGVVFVFAWWLGARVSSPSALGRGGFLAGLVLYVLLGLISMFHKL